MISAVTNSRAIRSRDDGAPNSRSQVLHTAPGPQAGATSKPKPIRCDPRWRAADLGLQEAIAKLTALLEAQEFPRQRQRRKSAATTFKLAIEMIVCNLVAVSMAAPGRPLAIPLSNAASKIAPLFGKPARKVIDLLLALKFITKVKGFPLRGPTTIKPTRKLAAHLPRQGKLDWSALRIADDPRVVLLNRGTPDDDSDDGAAPAIIRVTAETKRWLQTVTAEMEGINAAIRAAPIECEASALALIAEPPGKPMASLLTPHHRALRRTFNRTYDQGGRLFGGFWQTMPRADRFKFLRIAAARVCLCDYSNLFLRLAYAKARADPPPGDLYDVTGDDHRLADWQRLRDARKVLVNAMFFRRAPLVQWPGATPGERTAMREAFPNVKPRDAVAAIKQRHAPIADWFERGHGLRFMRTESDLIVAVTLALFKRGIVALPIHDAVLTAASHAETAKAVMQEIARRLTGADIPAAIETAAP
jgi:hypothetical protein